MLKIMKYFGFSSLSINTWALAIALATHNIRPCQDVIKKIEKTEIRVDRYGSITLTM